MTVKNRFSTPKWLEHRCVFFLFLRGFRVFLECFCLFLLVFACFCLFFECGFEKGERGEREKDKDRERMREKQTYLDTALKEERKRKRD